jgi:hypothetical protein
LEDFVETAVHAGIPSDDSLIQKFRTIFEKTAHLFEEGFGKGEQAYWDYIEREARTKLRGLYRTLIRENGTAVESMKDAYAVEIADRIVHDRQLCAFIAQLLLQIGFDGENLRGVPEQWVKRGTWPTSIKRIIAARDRGKCAECSVDILQELEASAHLDHIVPISRGGCNDIVNLQLLCARCNRKKRDQDRDVRSSVPRYIKRQAKG